MTATLVTDTAQTRQLTEFAADVSQLADERLDVELRDLVDNPHADLLVLRCETPTWWNDDELGTRCLKCGRRSPLRSRKAATTRAARREDFRIEQL